MPKLHEKTEAVNPESNLKLLNIEELEKMVEEIKESIRDYVSKMYQIDFQPNLGVPKKDDIFRAIATIYNVTESRSGKFVYGVRMNNLYRLYVYYCALISRVIELNVSLSEIWEAQRSGNELININKIPDYACFVYTAAYTVAYSVADILGIRGRDRRENFAVKFGYEFKEHYFDKHYFADRHTES